MTNARPSFFPELLDKTDRLPLWLPLTLSLVAYVLLVIWFPLPWNYDQIPLLDVRSFTPSLLAGITYGILLCILFGLFILAYRLVRNSSRSPGLPTIVGISVLFSLPLLMTYPINANDIYRYVIRGRVTSIYEKNPFIVSPGDLPGDPFLPFAGEWAMETSPYGPLWETVASNITARTGNNLLFGLLSFKLLGLIIFLATIAILWALFRSSRAKEFSGSPQEEYARHSAYTVLWAWNPALLLIFIADGHNDILMLFWLLLGLLVIQKGYAASGFLLMVLAVLTKPIAVLALPLFFVSLVRQSKSAFERVRFMLIVVSGGLLLSILLFLPYGSPVGLVQRLMREAGSGGGFSPAALGLLIAQYLGITLNAAAFSRFSSLLIVLFLIFVAWLLWRTWCGRSAVRGAADIFFGYLVQALNFRLWYAAWPFPWLLVDAGKEAQNQGVIFRLHYGLWFLLASQLSVLIYGHIRVFVLAGSQFLAHLLGVTFTFLLPLLLAWLSTGRHPIVREGKAN